MSNIFYIKDLNTIFKFKNIGNLILSILFIYVIYLFYYKKFLYFLYGLVI